MMSGLRDGPEDAANPESRKRRVPSCDAASVDKRRREQEGHYVEELAELLSSNLSHLDRLHVMPDKCRILHKTLQQIQLTRGLEQGKAVEDGVKQTDDSSSSLSLTERDSLGPLLLEALDGFLFVVNAEGRIVCVSKNVTTYLGYSREELINTSVCSILHLDDRAEFTSKLPKPHENCVQQTAVSSEQKSCALRCRMLVRAAGEAETAGQDAGRQYEFMQCFSMLRPSSGDLPPSLVCIARRLLRPHLTPESESFITKQDTTGKIISIDANALRGVGRVGWEDVVRRCIHTFFQPQEQRPSHAKQLLQEVLKNGAATSVLYRFSLSDGTVLRAQTKCKLCYPVSTGGQPFIMSAYSVYREQSPAAPQQTLSSCPSVPQSMEQNAGPAHSSPPSGTNPGLAVKLLQDLGSGSTGASGATNLRCSPGGPVNWDSSAAQSSPTGSVRVSPRAQGSPGNTFSPGPSLVSSPTEPFSSNPKHTPNLTPTPNTNLEPNPTPSPHQPPSLPADDYSGAPSLPVRQPVSSAARGSVLDCKVLPWCGAEGALGFSPVNQASVSARQTESRSCRDVSRGKLLQLLTSGPEQTGPGDWRADPVMFRAGSATEHQGTLQHLLRETVPCHVPLLHQHRKATHCGQEPEGQPLLRHLLDTDEPRTPGLSLDSVKSETASNLLSCTSEQLSHPNSCLTGFDDYFASVYLSFTDLNQPLPSLEEAVQLPSNCQKNGASNSLASRGRREQHLDPLHTNTVTRTLQRLQSLPELDMGFRRHQTAPSTRGDEPPWSNPQGTGRKEDGSFGSPPHQLLYPPGSTEAQDDEKALLDQLVSFLSAKDEVELMEIDRALGIDKLIQSGDLSRLQNQTLAPPYMLMEPKSVVHQQGYPAACRPPPAPIQYLGLVPQQHPAFSSTPGQLPPRTGYPLNTGLPQYVPGRTSSVTNQLRLQLQQRLQGQGPLNAQMVAQRRREHISQQHRQQQMLQRALLMRQQMPPSSGAQQPRSSPSQVQPHYSSAPANPPPSTSPFSPLLPSSDSQSGLCTSLHGSAGVLGTTGVQPRDRPIPQIQQNTFQVPTSALPTDVGLAPTLSSSSPTTSPLIQPPPQASIPAGYEAPERKMWQQDSLGRNSVHMGAGQQHPMYNNVRITVSMDTEPGSVSNRVSGQMHVGTMQLPSISSVCPEQVQQVQVFADVQCTVNVVGGDGYLKQMGPMGPQKGQAGGGSGQGQQKSLLQQLLTD